MSLTLGDKAECKEIAREIMQEVMMAHIVSCPHGRIIANAKWLFIGLLGANAAGGGVVALVIHLLGGA